MSSFPVILRTILPLLLLSLALPAQAYIGPGSGLGAIGVMAGMIAAIGLALVGFFWYPLKRLLGKDDAEDDAEADAQQAGDPQASREDPGTGHRP